MRQKIALPLALGIALAAPLSAHAAFGGPVHHYRPIHHRSVAMRTEAPAPAVAVAPAARIPSALELQGLSRNPDDCVKYGCVGNN
jgi:hypothetical protein